MEIKLKSKLIVIVLSSLLAGPAFAECKSVMGACVKEDIVNSAPHMRSDYVNKTKVVHSAPEANLSATNTTPTNNKNRVVKNGSSSVLSTIKKVALN